MSADSYLTMRNCEPVFIKFVYSAMLRHNSMSLGGSLTVQDYYCKVMEIVGVDDYLKFELVELVGLVRSRKIDHP